MVFYLMRLFIYVEGSFLGLFKISHTFIFGIQIFRGFLLWVAGFWSIFYEIDPQKRNELPFFSKFRGLLTSCVTLYYL